MWKCKGSRTAKITLKNKSTLEGLTLLYFNTHKAIIIKRISSVWVKTGK